MGRIEQHEAAKVGEKQQGVTRGSKRLQGEMRGSKGKKEAAREEQDVARGNKSQLQRSPIMNQHIKPHSESQLRTSYLSMSLDSGTILCRIKGRTLFPHRTEEISAGTFK